MPQSREQQRDDRCLLLAAAQAGDERAFRALIDPYRHALAVHCYRMLGSPQDAEDLTQETLLRAWRALERFQPRAQFQTWLYRIATNACLDELERRPRRPEPVDPFPDSREPAAAALYDPAARYAIREGMELALLRAIQELPGRQRAVLIFRDVLGWTAPETAELLESTVASVNSALQRARAIVERQLPDAHRGEPAADERALLNRYVAAFQNEDIDGLVALLREDASLRMPPQRTLVGAAAIARFFRDVPGRGELGRLIMTPVRANGGPGAVMHVRCDDGSIENHGILVLDFHGGQIARLEAFLGAAHVARFGLTRD